MKWIKEGLFLLLFGATGLGALVGFFWALFYAGQVLGMAVVFCLLSGLLVWGASYFLPTLKEENTAYWVSLALGANVFNFVIHIAVGSGATAILAFIDVAASLCLLVWTLFQDSVRVWFIASRLAFIGIWVVQGLFGYSILDVPNSGLRAAVTLTLVQLGSLLFLTTKNAEAPSPPTQKMTGPFPTHSTVSSLHDKKGNHRTVLGALVAVLGTGLAVVGGYHYYSVWSTNAVMVEYLPLLGPNSSSSSKMKSIQAKIEVDKARVIGLGGVVLGVLMTSGAGWYLYRTNQKA